jgi:hypothetical protein
VAVRWRRSGAVTSRVLAEYAEFYRQLAEVHGVKVGGGRLWQCLGRHMLQHPSARERRLRWLVRWVPQPGSLAC